MLHIAGKDVQLSDDTYVEGIMVAAEVAPGARIPSLPIAIIHRGPYTIAISIKTGEMYFDSSTPKELAEAMRAFDFLIQIFGEDKIIPPAGCADCVMPESPLPTPTPKS
jgi:hypothetical protein